MCGDPQQEAHSITHSRLQSSSQQEMPALAEPTGTPWCWGLRGLELMVIVPIHNLGTGAPGTTGMQPESLQWLQHFGVDSLVQPHKPFSLWSQDQSTSQLPVPFHNLLLCMKQLFLHLWCIIQSPPLFFEACIA